MEKGSENEAKREQTWCKSEQTGAKREQKGAQMEPKNDQNAYKNRPSEKVAKKAGKLWIPGLRAGQFFDLKLSKNR